MEPSHCPHGHLLQATRSLYEVGLSHTSWQVHCGQRRGPSTSPPRASSGAPWGASTGTRGHVNALTLIFREDTGSAMTKWLIQGQSASAAETGGSRHTPRSYALSRHGQGTERRGPHGGGSKRHGHSGNRTATRTCAPLCGPLRPPPERSPPVCTTDATAEQLPSERRARRQGHLETR